MLWGPGQAFRDDVWDPRQLSPQVHSAGWWGHWESGQLGPRVQLSLYMAAYLGKVPLLLGYIKRLLDFLQPYPFPLPHRVKCPTE